MEAPQDFSSYLLNDLGVLYPQLKAAPETRKLITGLFAGLASGENAVGCDSLPDDMPEGLCTVGPAASGDFTSPFVFLEGAFTTARIAGEVLLIRRAHDIRNKVEPVSEPEYPELADVFRLDESQQKAAIRSASGRLFVLTGGPGSGKTTTLTAILTQALLREPALRIRMIAPSGKAAARLQESVAATIARARSHGVHPDFTKPLDALSEIGTSTIHRALGIRIDQDPLKDSKPLYADLVVVDEVSMLSQSLLAAIYQSASDNTRFIFAGDADQLPSVETGRFLQDCAVRAPQIMTRLTKNHRAGSEALAEFLNRLRNPEVSELFKWLRSLPEESGVQWMEISDQDAKMVLRREISVLARQASASAGKKMVPPVQVLTLLSDSGEFSSAGINTAISAGINGSGEYLICTRNNYQRSVFNGDTGLRDESGGFLLLAENRLVLPPPAGLQPAYAMTVHKSQGSEYDAVFLVVPPLEVMTAGSGESLLNRSLLYTAASRARKKFTLLATADALERMIRTHPPQSGVLSLFSSAPVSEDHSAGQ